MSSNNPAIEKRIEKFDPNAIVQERLVPEDTPLRTTGAQDVQFATNKFAQKPTKADKISDLKQALLSDPTAGAVGTTPYGDVQVTDKDLRRQLKLAELAEKADLDQWFAQEYDLMGVAQKKWAREHLPEFYRARDKVIKQQSKNALKLMRLKLHGVQNRDDLMTQYLAESGRLNIGAFDALLNPTPLSQQENQRAFFRGALNPLRMFSGNGVEFPRVGQAQTFDPGATASDTYQMGATKGPVQFGAVPSAPYQNSAQDNGVPALLRFARQ